VYVCVYVYVRVHVCVLMCVLFGCLLLVQQIIQAADRQCFEQVQRFFHNSNQFFKKMSHAEPPFMVPIGRFLTVG
jgi:hypothetical protein